MNVDLVTELLYFDDLTYFTLDLTIYKSLEFYIKCSYNKFFCFCVKYSSCHDFFFLSYHSFSEFECDQHTSPD